VRAPSPLRTSIAELAAELMLDEDIKQYFTAKRLAAKRLLGQGRSGSACVVSRAFPPAASHAPS